MSVSIGINNKKRTWLAYTGVTIYTNQVLCWKNLFQDKKKYLFIKKPMRKNYFPNLYW